MNIEKYKPIEISGQFLLAGFSIYLIEIIKEDEKWFYVGMTGDNHYQSARSAFHRLAGHLELNPKSTQNQTWKYLKQKAKIEEIDLHKCLIKMYHFPIEGFNKTDEYDSYKEKQQAVRQLESKLIFDFKPSLLNETKGKDCQSLNDDFNTIYREIKEIIFSPLNTEGV